MVAGLRSLLAFVALSASFVAAGTLQRFMLWPLFLLRPALREPVMRRFMFGKSWWVLALARAGGARLRRTGRVPTDGPVLILMNHQSLLDIVTAIQMCRPNVPAIVTRRLYARGIPMVSPMLRIQRYPLVSPHDDPRGSIAALRDAVRIHEHGIVLFPEGHRTRNGELSPFETAGVRVILGQRRMPVYLVVTDGFWRCRALGDFVFDMSSIRGRTEVLGPFAPPEPSAALAGFVQRMHDVMAAHLQSMRAHVD